LLEELKSLPSLLASKTSLRAAVPENAATWHYSAAATLVQRLDSLLNGLTHKNIKEITNRAKVMVQRFVAERELRFSQPVPKRSEAAAGEIAEEGARQLHKQVEVNRKRLQKVSAAPKPMYFAGMVLKNDEVIIRWNQLADFFIQAHQRHAVFVESRLRALDAAEEAANAVDHYLACGLEQQKVQEIWQKQVRAEERADDALLEAWAATVAAQERLMMSVQQGLVSRVVEATPVDPTDARNLHCERLSSFASKAHKAAVKSVDRSLWPLVEQLTALEWIARYQDQQLSSKRLQKVARVPVDGAVAALYQAAAGAANPEDPSGRALAANALDTLGPLACPAPTSCNGMRVANASFGAWVATAPGKLLLGSDPQAVMVPCTGKRHAKDHLSLAHLVEAGVISPEQAKQDLRDLGDSQVCDEPCRSQVAIQLAPQRSLIAEAMLKLR